MTSNPPSLQSLCVLKLIEDSDEEISKINAPSLITDEIKLVKDKIKKDRYKSDYLLNLEFINRVEKELKEINRIFETSEKVTKLEKENLEIEKDEIKKMTEHLNYGKNINTDLMKTYMITESFYPFIKNFNNNLDINDHVKSNVFGNIYYIEKFSQIWYI